MLPKGWVETKLEDFCDLTAGQSPAGHLINKTEEGLPFFQGKGEFGTDYPSAKNWCLHPPKQAERNDILISVRAPVGPTNYAPEACGIGRGLASVTPLQNIPSAFVRNALHVMEPELKSKATGSTFEAITIKVLKNSKVYLPPLAEQRRIVAKLDSLTARIARARAELERTIELKKNLENSILYSAFCGNLTASWRLQNKGNPIKPYDKKKASLKSSHATSNDSPKPFLVPDTWRWYNLSDLGDLGRGKSRHRPRNDKRLYGGEHAFIQTGDIRSAGQYLSRFKQTYSDFGLNQSKKWPRGTVCITIAANIAETTILDIEACFPDSIVGFLPTEGRTLSSYIEYFIRTIKDDLYRFAPATAQKNINLEILRTISVPTPPFSEQKEIIRLLDKTFSAIRSQIAEARRALALLDRLDASLLAKAFRGELVPQDPNDEPASVLLDRIRAERAAAPKLKRGRKQSAHAMPLPRKRRTEKPD